MNGLKITVIRTTLVIAALLLAGCASIYEQTHAYLGSPKYPPTDPAHVRILQAEPKQPKDRLGEIILGVDGSPSRDELEKRLRQGAARLGADAIFIVYDRTHIFPVVYGDWWGPPTIMQGSQRNIVGVAIKYK